MNKDTDIGFKAKQVTCEKTIIYCRNTSSVELFMEQQRDFQNIYADNKVLVEIEILQLSRPAANYKSILD